MYTIREEANADGFQIIEIVDTEFAGIAYSYSSVSIEEDNEYGGAVLHFKYDIALGEVHENKRPAFEKVIGDILMDILEKQLQEREVVYAGGTNRLE